MKKDDCIFCKIAGGEIPSKTLYEDEYFRVFLDLGPASKGHCLIVPKEHFDNLFELSDEYASRALVLARKVGLALKTALNADGINIVQNNGEVAGQSVMHFHMHIIPRYEGGNELPLWKPGELTEDLSREILEKFKI